MKTALRLLVSCALSVLFLWFAFRNVDLAGAWEQIKTVETGYVLLYLVCLVVIQACRVFRYDVLIRPFVRISTRSLLRVSNVGLMLIFALPLRLGEFGRPYLLKRESGAPISAGLGAAAVERTVDGLLITFLFFVTTSLLSAEYTVRSELRVGAYASLAIFGSATVVIVAALLRGPAMSRLLHRIGDPISRGFTNKAVGMLEAFITGLRALPNLRAVGSLLAYTLVYWAANGLGLYFVMKAFGFGVPPIAGFVIVSVLVLGIMIPAGPGHLGTFQAAIGVGLAVFGIDDTSAQAYGAVVYPMNAAVIIAFGLPYLFSGRIGVRNVISASAQMGEEPADEPADEPVDDPADEPVDEPADEPAASV